MWIDNKNEYISFEVLKVMIVKTVTFWVVTSCCFRVDADVSEEYAPPFSCLKCSSEMSAFAHEATRCHNWKRYRE
jgi:hypothetical protein